MRYNHYKMPKSLSEQLALLTQPKNDFDIEDSEIKDNVFDHEDDEGSASEQDESLKKQHYVDVPRSKLRQQASVSLGQKYNGSVTSRDDLYASDNEEASIADEGDEFLADDKEDIEDLDNNDSDSGASLRANSDEEDSSEEEEESDAEDSDLDQRNSELEHKRSRVKELMSKERTHIVNRLSNSATSDSLKGFAISQQHKFFDKIIDSRLKIQKSLTNSNLLPPDQKTLDSQKLSTKKTAKNLQKAKEHCYDLLDSIFALRRTLYIKDQVTDQSFSNPKKRTFHEYSSVTSKMDSALNKYRSNVLTKWSAKVQNSSGATAINAGKFRAINQSFEQQVMNNLTDMDRLVKRTKLNRRHIKPLGYDYYRSQFEEDQEGKEEDEEEENPDIPKDTDSGKSSIAELEIIFDDEDFYRVLLNDLVDKKIQSSNPTTGLTVSLRSVQQAQKLKKNVDTKASKGRKLRYHIQEPIANFEAPRGSLKWDDNQIDEFFASLLGQKVNMNEDEEHEEEDEEEVQVGSDTIKLFG